MELTIKDTTNASKGTMNVPVQFDEPIREDIIKKAAQAYWANNRQTYGAFSEAGKRPSAKLSRRRHKYRGGYGFGISRVPRKIMSRRGTRMSWVGAFAPGTVGGRRAHAPKAEKIWGHKINTKERRKALRSAMAATINKEVVVAKGYKVPKDYPFAVTPTIEELSKTKDLVASLRALGFADELARTSERKIRAGKGKSRGRKYKTKTGVLIVVSKKCPLLALDNIPGVDIVDVHHLDINMLAPGSSAGRASLWTESALKAVGDEKLYL